MNQRRLIETAFPLQQTSLDSVHEKNVRHGHISTLHIYPARRPLAACRAALIATLLPDPESDAERKELLEKLAGKIKQTTKRTRNQNGGYDETLAEETEGGILHWGRETTNKAVLDEFRQKIKAAYGGHAPRVLDPFAGGGAIPLEAMRLGCDVTAVDINPVAWFVLKCTLEYPQKLAGKKLPLPDFALRDREFMTQFFKAQGLKKAAIEKKLKAIGFDENLETTPPLSGIEADAPDLQADLAWQVRAWGAWVLQRARRELASYYPTYAEFEPLKPHNQSGFQPREPRLVTTDADGLPNVAALNAEFDQFALQNKLSPRWIAKPTVAYLWARTVTCKNCRATLPLLKTRWLCKKDNKRVRLTIEPNEAKNAVEFGVEQNVKPGIGSTARRREHDKQLGGGTMSRAGAKCPMPNCGVIMTTQDIQVEGRAGRLGTVMTAVVVEGQSGKEYRLPTNLERERANAAADALEAVFSEIPFGLPDEPLPSKEALGFRVPLYGFDRWHKLFTPRQLLALGVFVQKTRTLGKALKAKKYKPEWIEAITAYLSLALDRCANRASTLCIWNNKAEEIEQTFARFALPIMWDFAESNPPFGASGNYAGELNWVGLVCNHVTKAAENSNSAETFSQSATEFSAKEFDVIITDPPYYDAIPYSDLMDFFYIWLRRTNNGLSPEIDSVFSQPLSPKWNHDKSDGELIDDSSRFGGDRRKSKQVYEDGMSRVFEVCQKALKDNGRFVIVFAHKQPDAWETLVAAIIRAGFVVDASYPIQTERSGRMRANSSAALASSIWLVCKKRPAAARVGWDNVVSATMRGRIRQRLRDFWDAGLRGPDFVWAATGPALESYSQHPIVKKANQPGELMSVGEFLRQVRRLVVDFVVGRVLHETNGSNNELAGLDDVTTYYLLHRHDFKFTNAPVGACILYAVSCNLSDGALVDHYDVLARTGGSSTVEIDFEDDEETDGEEIEPAEPVEAEGRGSRLRLKDWRQRTRKQMGFEAAHGKPIPLIDNAHRLMHFWRAGDVVKVDEYLDAHGLRQNGLFNQLLQALIELAPHNSEERSLLESISNHIAARGARVEKKQLNLPVSAKAS